MTHRPFRVALGLYVTPDFAAVMAGRSDPPWIFHSQIDFEALAVLFSELFHFGPPVQIRVPNDSIDQVTLQGRQGQIPGQRKHPGDPRCSDFGTTLLRCADQQSGRVIDTLDAWLPLHSIKERVPAPPPSLLPFVIEAKDFEDAMIWSSSAKTVLGLSFLPREMARAPGEPSSDVEEGTLPKAYRKRLGDLFGCKFEATSIIDRLAMDPLPEKYKHLDIASRKTKPKP